MLGKLIKHEWKNTYKIGGLMLLCIGIITALGVIPMNSQLWIKAFRGDGAGINLMDIMSVMSLIFFIIALAGLAYAMIIYLGVHFYKSTYTDEGYLAHTLPVTPHQLLLSRMLVGGIWYFLTTLAVVVSIFALIFFLIAGILRGAGEPMSLLEFLEEVFVQLKIQDPVALKVFKISAIHGIIYLLVLPFTSTVTLFGAITIGQLSHKYKAMMGIVTYIGVTFVHSVIASLAQIMVNQNFAVTRVGTVTDEGIRYVTGSYNISIVTSTLMAVGIYFIAHYIVSKKLNMD